MNRYAPIAILSAVALCALSLTVAAFAYACAPTIKGSHFAASHVGAQVCFPFKDWGPASVDRAPCYTIPHPPYEDGSGRIIIGTVSNDLAECVIPNVTEERGHFTADCWRDSGK